MKPVAIVLGTYNRLALLHRAVASIRASVGPRPYRIFVCDGGSTDGTVQYLSWHHDIVHLHGGLDGAVKAFNKGFARAVDDNFPFVMHLNDDAEIDHGYVEYPIHHGICRMEQDPTIGELAFAMDLRGGWGFEKINGAPYGNFGIIRKEAGMEVARMQGDPSGKAWWNPIYRTYGADCEFGANLWRAGWVVYPMMGLRVHDLNHQDELREGNTSNNKNGDSDLFWSRWRDVDLLQHVPARVKVDLDILERATSARPGRRRSPNPEYEK